MPTLSERRAAKRLDADIRDIFRRRCSNIEFDIMDIPKIFTAGRNAASMGLNVEDAIVSFVQTIRKN